MHVSLYHGQLLVRSGTGSVGIMLVLGSRTSISSSSLTVNLLGFNMKMSRSFSALSGVWQDLSQTPSARILHSRIPSGEEYSPSPVYNHEPQMLLWRIGYDTCSWSHGGIRDCRGSCIRCSEFCTGSRTRYSEIHRGSCIKCLEICRGGPQLCHTNPQMHLCNLLSDGTRGALQQAGPCSTQQGGARYWEWKGNSTASPGFYLCPLPCPIPDASPA